jgi:hypothetical protein
VSELELCRTRLAEALLRAEQAERELAALEARLATVEAELTAAGPHLARALEAARSG